MVVVPPQLRACFQAVAQWLVIAKGICCICCCFKRWTLRCPTACMALVRSLS